MNIHYEKLAETADEVEDTPTNYVPKQFTSHGLLTGNERHFSHNIANRHIKVNKLTLISSPRPFCPPLATHLAPYGPQLHRLVLAGRHETVLVIEDVHLANCRSVAVEALHQDLLGADVGVDLGELVQPVGLPRAAQVPAEHREMASERGARA